MHFQQISNGILQIENEQYDIRKQIKDIIHSNDPFEQQHQQMYNIIDTISEELFDFGHYDSSVLVK